MIKMEPVIFQKPRMGVLKKEGFICVDGHCHTNYSDGARLEKVLRRCRIKGVGIAVTDHNEIRGAVEAARQKEVPVIPGIEINTSDGPHFLAYFYSAAELKEFYKKNIQSKKFFNARKFTNMADIGLAELAERLEKYNCVKCLPHPYAPAWLSISRIKEIKKILKGVDAIEVISGLQLKSANRKAHEMQLRFNKAPTGGSDAHRAIDIGSCLTAAQASDTEQFLDAIRKKKTIAVGKCKMSQKAYQGIKIIRKDARRMRRMLSNKVFSKNDPV